MNRNHRFPSLSPDDVFEEAVERLESGEPIDTILASYPEEFRDELRENLSIVAVTQQIRHRPVPRPSAARQKAAKDNFLQAAADLRQRRHMEERAQVRSAERRRITSNRPSFLEQMRNGLRAMFTIRAVRLAPIIVVLAVLLLSTTTVVTMAQSAVPGDLAYSFKQWMRKQELQLAPPGQREIVRQEQERELAEDVKKAAAKADQNSAVIRAEDTQVYYGKNGRLLKVGGLTVMDRYQPDANRETFEPMSVEGDLSPGATVNLVYQIMPGQSDTVQGIALSVVAPPEEIVPAVPESAATPVIQPREQSCVIEQPDGWVTYQVQAGDNLTFIAQRGNTTIDELVEVNCLQSETIWVGVTLYVPASTVGDDIPFRRCGVDLPEGWVAYEIQPGDALSVIAIRGGTSVDELMEVNCLQSDTIILGSTLYVPPAAAE